MRYLWVELELYEIASVGSDLFGTELKQAILSDGNDMHNRRTSQSTDGKNCSRDLKHHFCVRELCEEIFFFGAKV